MDLSTHSGSESRANSSVSSAHEFKWSVNFSRLWRNRAKTDVTFTLKGRLIKAHKLILKARSPVFAAMFQESAGKPIDVYEIEDDYSVFRQVLQFIYTGRIANLRNRGHLSLLAAAEKYRLEPLKTLCLIGGEFKSKPDDILY